MKRLLTIVATVLLAGCQLPIVGLNPTQAPAPLAKTTVDDSALQTAWKAHDALQDALNLYMDAKPSVIGTPAAHRVADINDAITAALTAAEAAAAAGSTTDYLVALAKAKEALANMRTALLALKGK